VPIELDGLRKQPSSPVHMVGGFALKGPEGDL
jgi:hypothetical protein